MEVAGSHALIIVLAVLHEIWLPRTLAAMWPRTQLGRWFPANDVQYAAALRSARFIASTTTNRLLCFVTLGLVLGRRDIHGYVLGIGTLLVVVWMLSSTEGMNDERFFERPARVGGTEWKPWRRVAPAAVHLAAVVFLNAVPMALAIEDWHKVHVEKPVKGVGSQSGISEPE